MTKSIDIKDLGKIDFKSAYESMKSFIKTNPNVDFCAIIYELEKPVLAIKKNFYMPLVLVNLLIDIQKHFKK